MWPKRQARLRQIVAAFQRHAGRHRPMPGIAQRSALDTLALQYIASCRREDYYRLLQQKVISRLRADPHNALFNPERAIAYHLQQNNVDEAAWLVFLMTHFGRPANTGWRRLQDVYGMLGRGIWDWALVSRNPAAFSRWMSGNWTLVGGQFGSHRKYESLRPTARRDIGSVLTSYLAWVGHAGHDDFFAVSARCAGNDPAVIFDYLYRQMDVVSFGRLAKFDYLAMLGRYRIAPIEAGSAYLRGASGPLRGARLLFDGRPDGSTSPETLQLFLDELDATVGVGMTVTEDALCNWQKSPTQFEHFRG